MHDAQTKQQSRKRCDISNQAIMVCGSQCSGTSYMAQLLVDAGCVGMQGDAQSFDILPGYGVKIPDYFRDQHSVVVFHRTYPHHGLWPSILDINQSCKRDGYSLSVIVMSRDIGCVIREQLDKNQVASRSEALGNIGCARRQIVSQVNTTGIPSLSVRYENLGREEYTRHILGSLGLNRHAKLTPFVNHNAKYYTGVMTDG